MTNHDISPRLQPAERPRRESSLDSPWFWICLFASVAAVALVAIGPKFRKREAKLESTFQMREHLARRNAGDANHAVGEDDEYAPSTSAENGTLLKTTGPLIWILLAVAIGSWSMLMRSRPARNANAQPPL